MFKYIPGNYTHKISLSGEVQAINDDMECTPIIKDGKIYLTIYNKTDWFCLQWLGLVAHFEVNLPYYAINRFWDIRFVDTDKKVTKSISGKVMVLDKPIWFNKIYRIVPGFTSVAVSKEGILYDLMRNKTKNYKTNSWGGYITVSIYNPDKGIYTSERLHRLVALAWCENNDFVDKPIVNHLDGNKTNPNARNLEWCSYRENSVHAVQNNLRLDNLECNVFDIVTRSITKFSSFREASLFMGMKEESIRHSKPSKFKARLVNNRYQFKLASDSSPWFYQDKPDVIKCGRYITTVTDPLGVVEKFYDLRDLRKQYCIWNVPNINEIVNKFKSRYPGYNIEIHDNYTDRYAQAIDINTGVIYESESVIGLSRLVKINRSTIMDYLDNQDETKVLKGYAFRYKTDVEWNKNFVIPQSRSVCILATNTQTKQEIKLSSLRTTAKHFNTERCVIKRVLNKAVPVNGWMFKEIT